MSVATGGWAGAMGALGRCATSGRGALTTGWLPHPIRLAATPTKQINSKKRCMRLVLVGIMGQPLTFDHEKAL
jgi:hypothetical protein